LTQLRHQLNKSRRGLVSERGEIHESERDNHTY
jgi:hypothetical protein